MDLLKQTFQSFGPTWNRFPVFRLYVVLVFAAVIFQCIQGVLLIDSYEYMNSAKNLSDLQGWDCCYQGNLCDVLFHQTRRTPGYPLYLMLSGNGLVSRIIQCIPAVLVPLLSLRLLAHFTTHSGAARLLLWFLLLYPLQYYYSSLIMPEIWVQFFLLWLALSLFEKRYAVSVVLACVLALFKPIFLPFLFLSPLLYIVLSARQKWVVFIPLLVYLAVGFANKNKTGVFHYTSMGTVNAWDYNARAVLNKTEGAEKAGAKFALQDSIVRSLSFSEGLDYLGAQTQNVILSNLPLYAYLHIRGALFTLLDPGRYDFIAWWGLPEGTGLMGIKGGAGLTAFLRQPPLYLVYMILFLLLGSIKLLLALISVFSRARYQRVWILLFLIIVPLSMVGPVGSARYLMPVAPIICILAALGATHFNPKEYENTAR